MELHFISERLRRAHGGIASVVIILGEAGLGKTRLLEEFRKLADNASGSFGIGSCLDYARVALRPFCQILARASQGRCEMTSFDDQGASIGSTERTSRLFDSVLDKFRELALSAPPLLAVIEDLHWADDASLQMLEHIAGRITTLPLCLLVTCREEAVDGNPQVAITLSRLLRGGAHALYLEPLSEGDVRFLTNAALEGQSPLPTTVMQRIEHLAAGNPLYLEELLRETLDGVACSGIAREHIPNTLRATVMERFHRLPESARDILTKAAVLGEEFDLWLLTIVSHSNHAGIVEALQQAADAHFIHELEAINRYHFRHPLIREVLYSRLTRASAALVHASAAKALETQCDHTKRLAERAYHWSAAGEGPMALRCNEAAGTEAAEMGMYRVAAQFFRRALDFCEPGDPSLPDLNEKLGRALYCDGSLHESKQYLLAAIDGRLGAGSALAAIPLIDVLYSAYHYDGDAAAGLAFASRILQFVLDTDEPSIRDALLIETAGFFGSSGMENESSRILERISKPQALPSSPSAVELHVLHAIELATSGCFTNAIVEFERALTLSQRDHNNHAVAGLSGNLATCYELMGDLENAERFIRRALVLTDEKNLGPLQQCSAAIHFAEVLLVRGRISEAIQMTQSALSLGVSCGLMRLRVAVTGIRVSLLAQQEALLSRCADESVIASAFDSGKPGDIACVTEAFVKLYLHRGRTSDATALLTRAMSGLDASHFVLEVLMTAAKYGSVDEIPSAHALVLDICSRRPRAVARAYVPYFRAIVAQRERCWTQRRDLAAIAVSGFEDLGMPLHLAEALELAGRQREALAVYRRVGAAAEVTRLEHLFTDRGHRGGVLTRRQTQIAKLLAAGHTNRQVAQALEISEKTLENHVTSIYRRVGVGSRGALIQYLAEQLG